MPDPPPPRPRRLVLSGGNGFDFATDFSVRSTTNPVDLPSDLQAIQASSANLPRVWPRAESDEIWQPSQIELITITNMKPTKTTATIKDTTTITLYEADLTGKKVGEFVETPKRTVPYSNELQWWMDYSPAGYEEADKGHLSVFMWVSTSVKATFTFAIEGSTISWTATPAFADPRDGNGWSRYASHEELKPLFRDGKLTITCIVEFFPNSPSMPRLYEMCSHVPADFTLEVGSKKLKVHRHFLSLISPVFNTMLSSDKSESRKMKIPHLEYYKVKAAIDFCYGRPLHINSIDTYFGILRFTNKYEINTATAEVERFLMSNLSIDSISTLLQYTYDFKKESLLSDCTEFFKDNEADIKKTEKFVKLPAATVVYTLKAAFDLKTDFEVLRHAHGHGYEFIIDELEKPLLTSMALEDFASAVSYAWDCSRENLKKACAQFCAKKHVEVMKLSDFFTLSPETIGGVMKMAYDLKQEP
uniref:BTB domain-containing protein n=1 Tax=Panagrellus redivivus TaxID=6233 RepID=A0A7E4UT02_PANRE